MTVHDVQLASELHFGPISAVLHAPGTSAATSAAPPCKTKTPPDPAQPDDVGTVTLSATDLGFPFPGITLPFHGRIRESDDAIVWTTDQRPDTDVSFVDTNGNTQTHHIFRIHGQIVTTVLEADHVEAGPSCGDPRVELAHRTDLQLTSESLIHIAGDIDIDDASLDTFSGVISAWQPLAAVHFQVRLDSDGWRKTDCGERYAMIGDTIHLHASHHHEISRDPIGDWSCAWTDASGHPLGTGWDYTFTALMDGPVTVIATVTGTTDQGPVAETATYRIDVLSQAKVDLLVLGCALHEHLPRVQPAILVHGAGGRHRIGPISVIDPTYDPTPDELRQVFSTRNVMRAQQQAAQIAKTALALETAAAKVLEEQQLSGRLEVKELTASAD